MDTFTNYKKYVNKTPEEKEEILENAVRDTEFLVNEIDFWTIDSQGRAQEVREIYLFPENKDKPVLFEQYPYKDNKYHGKRTGYDINTGHLIIENNYKNGQTDGIQKSYDRETGSLIEEVNYTHNKINGFWKRYDSQTRALNYYRYYHKDELIYDFTSELKEIDFGKNLDDILKTNEQLSKGFEKRAKKLIP